MSSIETKRIGQMTNLGTPVDLKLGGIANDGSDAPFSIDSTGNMNVASGKKIQFFDATETFKTELVVPEPTADGIVTIPNSGTVAILESPSFTGIPTINGYNLSPFAGFKNYLINGNFDVWQYATSQTSAGYGSDDRWSNINNGSTKTHSQVVCTDTERALFNASYFSRTVVTSVVGASNYTVKIQHIEDVTKLAGKTVTLSFWAKADSSKNIWVAFKQNFGAGGSPSTTVDGIYAQAIELTSTWQKKTITLTLPSIVGKTLGTYGVHTSSTEVQFWFDAGSAYTGRIPTGIQQSGTFDIAQVQLEEGSVATPFEHRPIGLELSLCQRYYEVSGLLSTNLIYQSSTWKGGVVPWVFKQTKRITPTIGFVQNTGTKVAIAQNITANSALFAPSEQSSYVSDYIACIATASAEL